MHELNASPCSQSTHIPCAPVQRTEDLLWVDYHDEKEKNGEIFRSKQAFTKVRYHRLKRESRLETLKQSMIKFPDRGPAEIAHDRSTLFNNGSSCNDQAGQKDKSVICKSPQASVAEAFPIFDSRTGQRIHYYLNYCKWPAPELCSRELAFMMRNLFD